MPGLHEKTRRGIKIAQKRRTGTANTRRRPRSRKISSNQTAHNKQHKLLLGQLVVRYVVRRMRGANYHPVHLANPLLSTAAGYAAASTRAGPNVSRTARRTTQASGKYRPVSMGLDVRVTISPLYVIDELEPPSMFIAE